MELCGSADTARLRDEETSAQSLAAIDERRPKLHTVCPSSIGRLFVVVYVEHDWPAQEVGHIPEEGHGITVGIVARLIDAEPGDGALTFFGSD